MEDLRTGRSPEVDGLAQQALDSVTDNSFFEDLSVKLSPLDSIDHFCRSSQSYQRLAYAQGIAAAAAAPTAEYGDCVEVLLSGLIQQLARDQEAEIRSTAVKQLPGLGTALYGKDAERSMRDIEAVLLVCAQQSALDDEDEVSRAGIVAFQQLVQLLPPARATAASKRAVDRLESNGSDEGTLAAVRLLAHTVAHWTPEALKRHVPRYIGRWAAHRDFSVREAVATCMDLIVPPMPLRLCHQVLLPAFYQLSRDQNWRVRRACALDLPRLASALHQHTVAAGAAEAVRGSSDSGSAEQPLGCCGSKPSTCLSVLQRHGNEAGSSSSNVLAGLAAAGGPQRNRSYPSLVVNRSPATSAQIMTKHPMHSSLIVDGLLSGSSSCNSMPGSPSGSSDAPSLAHDSYDDAHSHHHSQQQQQQQQHHHHHHDHHSLSDTEHQSEQHHGTASCKLQEQAELLHDCWCALRQCMELLTADSSHWVKVAALSGLGPFLLQLPPCQLSQLLLGRFMSMAGSTVVIYEVSVALACAQAFGRLAVLLGPDRWPEMRDAWHALQASRDPQVLCEVVQCLPRLVPALGPVLTHRELLPALAALLQSHLSWVGGHLVQVMADLLEHLPPSGHELLLKTLPQLTGSTTDRTKSWRVRRDLALQLGRLAAVAGPEAIEVCLWPTAMRLCCDPVAAVRTAAASQVGPIMGALPAHVLQAQEGGPVAENCAACNGSKRACSSPDVLCQARGIAAVGQHAAPGPAGAATNAAAAAGEAAGGDGGGRFDDDCSKPVINSHNSTSHASLAGTTPMQVPDSTRDGLSTADSSSKAKSKGRGKGISVRFALDHKLSSSAPQRLGQSALLADLVADSHSKGMDGCGSLDFDELELPSALAPAPAGCFSTLSDHCSGDDSDDAEAECSLDSASSGLSSSSSHSSDADAHDSGGGSSSSDESGNDSTDASDSDSDDESSSSGSSAQRWRGTLQSDQECSRGGVAVDSSQEEVLTTPAEGAPADNVNGLGSPSSAAAAAAPQRPLYTMHPAMMPVGALSAASAAASAPRAVPAAKRRPVPSRARSTGDLLRLQPLPSSASSAVQAPAPQANASVARLQERFGGRQLADSLPSAFLTADGSSDEESAHNSNSSWPGGLPEPAHAAPQQYLPCLVEYFGCSSSHQQRQLFVPLVMGLLACCHEALSCAQQALLLDRLEALAHDNVPGVRYAVAAALADVKVQAAALTGQQPQPQQPHTMELQQQMGDKGVEAHDGAAEQVVTQQEEAAQQEQQTAATVAAAAVCGDSRSAQPDEQSSAEVEPALQHQQQQQEGGQVQEVQGADATESQNAAPEHPAQEEEQQQYKVQEAPTPVSHVPRGAHPLLGYQAYVQQLAQHSSVPATSSAPASSTLHSPHSNSSVQPSHASRSSAAAPAAAVAAGRASAVLPPRSATSPAGSSRQQQLARQQNAAVKQQPSLAAPAAAQASSQHVAVVGASKAAAPVTAAGSAAATNNEEAKAAEWLKKLSNCQQLERLMHVVALTTGPL